jgi:hypothetical protein
MLWVLTLCLGVWALVLHLRIEALRREVRRLAEGGAVARTAEPPPRAEAEPAPPETFVPTSDPGPRVRLGPLAEASTAIADAHDVGDAFGAWLRGVAAEEGPRPPKPGPAARRRPARVSLETWLSQNGLAWIGGAALVIGGAFLVGFAAQQGVFTPPVRIASAGLLGGLLLAAGEALRRGLPRRLGPQALPAAIASGAGAAVLYGAAWAAYALYGFIGAGVCAGLLAGVAAGLLALAFVHGEALALLALCGAFVAPIIAARGEWGAGTLASYLAILIAAGLAAARLRGWNRAAWTALAGAGAWAVLALLEPSPPKAELLSLEPLAVLTLLRRAPSRRPLELAVGGGALALASFVCAVCLTGIGVDPRPHPGEIAGAVLSSAALPLLASWLTRRGAARPLFMAPPSLAFAASALMVAALGFKWPMAPWLWAGQAILLAGAGVWAAVGSMRPAAASGGPALGVLALGAALGIALDAQAPGLGPLAACALLALGTAAIARVTEQGRAQALEVWSASAAAALLLGLTLGLDWRFASAGFAAAMALLTWLRTRLRWTSLSAATGAACAMATGALVAPQLLTFALSGPLGAAWMLGSGAFAAAVALVCATRLTRSDAGASAEVLRTAAPMAALAGEFVFLRWLAGARTGLPLDPLGEAAVRTLLMAATGLFALARLDRSSSRLARWRADALMGAAGFHGLLLQGLAWSPWWGAGAHRVDGVPLLNVLAVAYLAPCLAFAEAARRSYARSADIARAYGLVSAAFGLLWLVLELHRTFHSGLLDGGLLSIGAGEALAAAALLLAAPFAIDLAQARAPGLQGTALADLVRGQLALQWAGVAAAVLLPGLWSSPWWGPAARPFAGPIAALGTWAGYGLCVAMLAATARRAGGMARPALQTAAKTAAAGLAVVLATLTARWLFHGSNLTPSAGGAPLETWTYSALWAVCGLVLLALGPRAGQVFARLGLGLLLLTAAKVFLFDMAHLSGAVRAASFIAVGALLLLGALTARRFALARPDERSRAG